MTIASPIRTLFLTNKVPYPPMGGATLRNWQNINNLINYGPVGVFYVHTEHEKLDSVPVAPPHVSYWGMHTVYKRRSLWKKIGRRLRLWAWMLTRIDPFTDLRYSPTVAEELDRVLREFQPDVVIFEELWLYCYLSVVKRHSCRVIYDAHNAETALQQQILQTTKRIALRIDARIKLAIVDAVERSFVQKSDQIWTCSEQDTQLLQCLSRKPLPISVIPNGVNTADYECVRLGQSSPLEGLEPIPRTLIFTASFGYEPNTVAAHLLLEQIFPRLQTIYPDCRLLLVGANPTESMQEIAKQNPGVIVTGRVPDIQPYLAAASVVVVPLLQGSGTRLKILEAFAAGRPVVSTSKGVEGITAQDGVHLLIRDDIEEFIAGITTIWCNPALSQKLAQAADELVQTHYSWEAAGVKTKRALEQLFEQKFAIANTSSEVKV